MAGSRSWWLSGVAVVAAAGLLAGGVAVASADDAPPCPQVFGHGGYPTGADAWKRDQVREPNNPAALRAQKADGAAGVEADVQLTRDGTKAVMWHDGTTYHLSGDKKDVNALWWSTGADRLRGRTIDNGPFKGETVFSLRQYLDAAYELKMVPLIEIKPTTEQSLLNADAKIRDRAWGELLAPVAERFKRQEIMLYTHDAKLSADLKSRAKAAGVASTVEYSAKRPVWPDTVSWEEPAPSWKGNVASWQKALDAHPLRMATSWTKDLSAWLKGRCSLVGARGGGAAFQADHVAPAAGGVAADAFVDADDAEAVGLVEGEACGVVGEDSGQECPDAGGFGVGDEVGQEPVAYSPAAGGLGDVHRYLDDSLVDVAGGGG